MAPLVDDDRAPIRVERLCAEITRALPADGILVADTGYSGIWTGTMIDFNGVGAELSARRRLARLGVSGLARRPMRRRAAQGRLLHRRWRVLLPSRRTRNRRGAAAFRPTVVVNNNSGFGQNLTGVRRIAGNRPGRGEELVRFGPTDFTAVARSFGVRGIRVERPGEIAPALAEALGAGRAGGRRCRDRSRAARSRAVVAGRQDMTHREAGAMGSASCAEAERRGRPGEAQPAIPRLRILSNTGAICVR